MHSTSHFSSLSVVACRCSYRTPLQLSYLHRGFHRLPPLKLAAYIAAFSYRRCRFPNPQLFTRSYLFSRMEVRKPTHATYTLSLPVSVCVCVFYYLKRFWAGSGISRNQEMVAGLQSSGIIRSKKVTEVMETIDRALFVPAGAPPYLDSPLPIGHNATISAPHMHAMCLELLENHLKPGMRAMDIGSGTGYLTACLAIMVGPVGRAVGVEHIPQLVEFSIKSIQKSAAAPLLKGGSLSIHAADGRLGWSEFALYDAIHVGAAAAEIPPALIEQLKPGGRLVIPVGNIYQDLQVIDKNADGSLSVRSETSVRYIPLTSREAQIRGY